MVTASDTASEIAAQTAGAGAVVPDRDELLAAARAEANLEDFGDPWFFGHIDALVAAFNNEAGLSAEGAYGAKATVVNSLVNRLRHVELIKRRPEILEEEADVAIVVVGLPRTGSTMLHRMLAAAPGMTAVRWFETQNYAPFPGEARGAPTARLQAAEAILAYMLDKIPELMAIHPMAIDQPDEELIILGQLFSNTMLEGTYFVPGFSKWLTAQDHRPAYRDLAQILQSLQWQDPSRRGKRWVLKTPGHLMALDALRETFPNAKIVMTHRDPVATVPSYCSMEETLYRLTSDEITPAMVADFWKPRLKELLDMFMSARARAPSGVFLDVKYEEQVRDPLSVGARVLEAAAGAPLSGAAADAARAGMAAWIDANRREDRAAHEYSLEEFGLQADDIRAGFADYAATFLNNA